MGKRKPIVVVSVFILILIGIRFSWLAFHAPSDSPTAYEGVLDLREIELSDDTSLSLDGEWDFFSGELITPKDEAEQFSGFEKTGITVPGDWKKSLSRTGYGTYQLQILLNESEERQDYTFSFKEIRSNSTVFINGEKVIEMGQVSKNTDTSISDYRPFEFIIDNDAKELNLLIQVSNYDTSITGGITKSIQFGTVQAVKKAQMTSFFWRVLLAGILLIHGVYALAIFFVFSRKKELIALAFTFFFGALWTLLSVDKALLYLFPMISSEWWFKLTNLTYASIVFFLLHYFKSVIAQSTGKKVLIAWAYKVLAIFYGLFILSVLLDYKPAIVYLLSIIMFFAPIMIPLALLKVVSKGGSDAIYLLLATTGITSSLIWGWIKSEGYVTFPYYPFDLMIGVLFFAIFWFKNFFQSAEESQKLAVELQEVDKKKDEFLANTSHELKNPLHGIMNITQVIYENEENLSSESKENLEILMTVSRRMSMVLNDLLDIEKLKEGGISLQKEKVSVSVVVTSVLDMIRFMKEGKNLTFINQVSEPLIFVNADENRLFQILFNLIHNAVKYTSDGDITVSAELKKSWAIIHVQDDGPGMDEETMASAFEPYERADASMTAVAGGMGLGLSICRKLVQLHGGTLSVDSTVGKGSTFTFTLPLASEPITEFLPQGVKEETKIEKPSVNKRLPRLLVVDDDPLNLAIIERILVGEGYDVTTCLSGRNALNRLEQGSWDLVISDVMMPNMSGYELTKRIREQFSVSELPILLLTSRSQFEDKQVGFSCGANDYVTKPVGKSELTMRVKSLIDIKMSIKGQVRIEAAWLQAQIQPHFLFNTLNTIVALSEIDPPQMTALLEQFGNYLRASFVTQNLDEVVPLENEINLIQSYVFIQQKRFGDRLQVEWEVDEIPDIQIPPLSLQTILENAINHGVLKRLEGGTVRIQIKELLEVVEIKIVDDGVGIAKERLEKLLTNRRDEQHGIGLLNTDKRLKQLFGHGLDIKSTVNKGTTVRFILPKEE